MPNAPGASPIAITATAKMAAGTRAACAACLEVCDDEGVDSGVGGWTRGYGESREGGEECGEEEGEMHFFLLVVVVVVVVACGLEWVLGLAAVEVGGWGLGLIWCGSLCRMG